jgi:hypothetical protein
MSADTIARLKITLDDVSPVQWARPKEVIERLRCRC